MKLFNTIWAVPAVCALMSTAALACEQWTLSGDLNGAVEGSAGAVTGENFDMKVASKKYGWRLHESAQCAVAAARGPMSAPASSKKRRSVA